MVFLNYLMALSFLSFSFGILLILISKKDLWQFFGKLFLLFASFLILSSYVTSIEKTIDTIAFFILGLIFISVLFFFYYRDSLYINSLNKLDSRESNE